MIDDLKQVARGWRWGRPAPNARSAKAPAVKTEAAFETEWAREHWARNVRALAQETVLLPVARAIASPTVIGRERLHSLRPPAVIVANHTSHLDTGLVVNALPRKWRDKLVVAAAADYFFDRRLKGLMTALVLGAYPVDRKRPSAIGARTTVRLLEEGWSILIFPEGGRSPDGWLNEVRPGAAFAAAKTGRPIVPVWLSGASHLFPKGAKLPRRGRVDVTIADPVYPAPGEDARVLNERLAQVLARLGRESGSDFYTAARGRGPSPAGPEAAPWRRIWERGAAPDRPRSDWD